MIWNNWVLHTEILMQNYVHYEVNFLWTASNRFKEDFFFWFSGIKTFKRINRHAMCSFVLFVAVFLLLLLLLLLLHAVVCWCHCYSISYRLWPALKSHGDDLAQTHLLYIASAIRNHHKCRSCSHFSRLIRIAVLVVVCSLSIWHSKC